MRGEAPGGEDNGQGLMGDAGPMLLFVVQLGGEQGVGLAALFADPCLLGLVPVSHARAGHAVAAAAGLQAEPDGTGAVVRDLALGVGDGVAADGLGAGMVGMVVYSRIGWGVLPAGEQARLPGGKEFRGRIGITRDGPPIPSCP